MASIRAKVRVRTTPSHASLPLEEVVERLNPVLRGWGAYFRFGNSSRKFDAVDCYVNQRLAQLASTKHGLRGWNWRTRFTHGWANSLGIHRLSGTGSLLVGACLGEPCRRAVSGRTARPVR
jgi:hypothetical protein